MEDGIDCRFLIGLVELKTTLNSKTAWNMMGPGLARARQTLNEKKSITRYRFSIEPDSLAEVALEALGAGLTVIERNWTDKQRRDIQLLLKGSTPAKLARMRNVFVHSIYKVRGSGNFETYNLQWNAIYEQLVALDKKKGLQ